MLSSEYLKYSSILSIPLFSITALLLAKGSLDFSFKTHTISKSLLFLNKPIHIFLFKLNFILKAFLDLLFAVYVINHFNIYLMSLTSLSIITSAILFGSLAYFVEGRFSLIHKIITYLSGTLWFIGYFQISILSRDNFFIYLSLFLLIIPVLLSYYFLFLNKTNVPIQALCLGIWYVWILVFVFQYL